MEIFLVYISLLIRIAWVYSYAVDINNRKKILTVKLLKQGYWYHKLRKTLSKFYRRHYDLLSKLNVILRYFLKQCLYEPEFYGDLVNKLRQNAGLSDFSDQCRKIIIRYKRTGYNMNLMWHAVCLVVNTITINSFTALFNCTLAGRALDSMTAST